MEDIEIIVEEQAEVNITVDTDTAYVIEVPGVSAASILTTTGDLLGYSTLPNRIPIGTDDQVLTVDSLEASGLKWADIPTPETDKIFEGNSSVEVIDTAAGEIVFTTDDNELMTMQTLTQPITISHAQSFLGDNSPLVLIEATGTSTANKGAILWLDSNRGTGVVDVDVFRIDNTNGEIFSIDNAGGIQVNQGQRVDEFSTDGTLAGDSDTALPTEKAVKTYVDNNAGASPLTTKGDLYTYSTVDARLPIGTNDYVLTADSTQATGMKWAASSSGFSDPMTTRGDIIYKNSAGTTTRLGAGTASQVLTSDGTDIAWQDPTGGTGGASDKIEEGDSSVEVVDTGTGQINMTLDGTQKVKLTENQYIFGAGSTALTARGILAAGEDYWYSVGANVASSTANQSPGFNLYRSKGTLASPTTVADGDRIAIQAYWGYTTGWKQPCNMIANIKGVSGANCGGTIDFYTANVSDGATKIVMTLDENGNTRPGADDTFDLGTASYRWDDIYATNATIQTSDERLKDNITASDLGLEFINALAPKSFKWKSNTVSGTKLVDNEEVPFVEEHTYNRKHYGMIAQDVIATCSGLGINTADFAGIIYEPEADRYGLRYNEFIAPMIKAIQEQSDLIDSLIARIEKLEGN
jgi:hypothetical protein